MYLKYFKSPGPFITGWATMPTGAIPTSTRPVLDRFHDSSKVNALCFMLYALCSMLYALCSMLYALCSMLYALCSMLYALCSMLYFFTTLYGFVDNFSWRLFRRLFMALLTIVCCGFLDDFVDNFFTAF